MKSDESGAPQRNSAREAYQTLASWLISDAYPRWSTDGVDPRGGFRERVSADGVPIHEPRRARVQPRQAYAFAQAPGLGWQGPADRLFMHGIDYFLARYRRPDGLFRTLISADGLPVDDRALLYDQAFALLAYAEGQKVLGKQSVLERETDYLVTAINKYLKRAAGAGFEAGLPVGGALLSNPHMHLFEASQAWVAASSDASWRLLADGLGELALEKFIDPQTGALREQFNADWSPAQGIVGRIVEPGHQYEWAWLLLRWKPERTDVRKAALRLIEIGEQHGVVNGVAINALLDDFSIHDPAARLWPQTERIKAGALAARLTGEARYWEMAASATHALLRYLDTPVSGLWYDRLTSEGVFVQEPAPASTFYHIVAAVSELRAAA